jgi:uncharacterized protein DUF885
VKIIPFVGLFLFASLTYAQNKTQHPVSANKDADFSKLVDRFFDEYYFKFNPSSGTAAGFHQYDNQLEDYSRATIQKQVAVLKNFKQQVEQIHAADLSPEVAVDRELVLGDINGRLLELGNIRQWEKNPDRYSSGVTNSIFLIMARTFAPPEQRLKSVIAREKQIPGVFAVARQNLKNPPLIYVNVALEQIPGLIGFFQKDVPQAFKDVKDEALLKEFQASNQTVMDALTQYQEYLAKEVKPKA